MSEPIAHADNRTVSVTRRAPVSIRLTAAATNVLTAIRDGLISMHRYEDLRAHGASHDVAAQQACAFKP